MNRALMQRCRQWDAMAPDEWVRRISKYARPFFLTVRDNAWIGEPCYIIGGGPSLRDFDFSRLNGRGRIIAVNRAFERAPFADILFSMDSLYFRWTVAHHRNEFRTFRGHKVFLDTYGFQYRNVELLKSAGIQGLTDSLRHGLFHGSNSGYAALNLAVALGANPIYLLGFDMRLSVDGRQHWHGGYHHYSQPHKLRTFTKYFDRLAPLIEKRGVTVINCCGDSALRCFKFGEFAGGVK